MTLTHCPDVDPARWITASPVPWQQLVTFGPSGFAAYARLRFLPDPAYPGQGENDAGVDTDAEQDTLRLLFTMLAKSTSTPEHCYFALWDGWGIVHGGSAVAVVQAVTDGIPGPAPRVAPAFDSAVIDGPKMTVPNRSYHLFRGALSDAADWGAAEMWPGQPRFGMPGPAFVWPADHAWCLAHDVDAHWAGIGAKRATIEHLLSDQRLDLVAADPVQPQPAYR